MCYRYLYQQYTMDFVALQDHINHVYGVAV
jgi:hypothetical protein